MTIITHDVATTDDAADTPSPVMDRRLKEQLLILMLMDSLRPDGNDDNHLNYETEKVDINKQLDMSKELMIVAQRLIDAKLLDLCHDHDRDVKSSCLDPSKTSEQQILMDDHEAAEVEASAAERGRAVATKKRKRMKKAKAAAKNNKTRFISWLGGAGFFPQMFMMAFTSITTLIITLSIIHQSVDGSGEGRPPPALPPTSSKSSKYLFHHRADSFVNSPSPTVAASRKPSITASANNTILHMESDEETSPVPVICFDTPGWRDYEGYACDDYRGRDDPGCPKYGTRPGNFGPANVNCCHCKGVQSTVSLCDLCVGSTSAALLYFIRLIIFFNIHRLKSNLL